MKNIEYGNNAHNRTRTCKRFDLHTHKCTHSMKHERDMTLKWRHSAVILRVPHIRINRDMMLTKDKLSEEQVFVY